MKRYFGFIFLCSLLASAIGAPLAYGQGVGISATGLQLSLSSSSPVPGQAITITAQSFGTDLKSSTVIWSVNGVEVKRGIGAATLEIIAPPLGQKRTVNVSATDPEGIRLVNSIVIGSGSVDIILEPDGYVPPFFLGKLAPAYQNRVKIIAIPHLADATGTEYDPTSLVYTWQKDDKAIPNQSGYGQQSIVVEGAVVPRPHLIRVDISTRDGSARATRLIEVAQSQPFLGFYVDDPLFGPLFNSAITNVVRLGTEREAAVLAVPFGFNKPGSGTGGLDLNWMINNRSQASLSQNQSIVLRAPEGTSGTSNISLQIQNGSRILQGARGGFSVMFSEEAETNEESLF